MLAGKSMHLVQSRVGPSPSLNMTEDFSPKALVVVERLKEL